MLATRQAVRVKTAERFSRTPLSRKLRRGFLCCRGHGIRPCHVGIRKSIGQTGGRCLCIIDFRPRVRRDGGCGATSRKTAMFARSMPQRRDRLAGRVSRTAVGTHVGREAAVSLQTRDNGRLRGIGTVVGRGRIDGQGTDALVHAAIDTAPSRLGGICYAGSLRRRFLVLVRVLVRVLVDGREGGRGLLLLLLLLLRRREAGRRMGAGGGRGIAVRVIMGVGRTVRDTGDAVGRGLLRGGEELERRIVGVGGCGRVG